MLTGNGTSYNSSSSHSTALSLNKRVNQRANDLSANSSPNRNVTPVQLKKHTAKEIVANSGRQNKKALPKTGNQNTGAFIALGVFAAMLGVGLGKQCKF